MLVWSLQSWSLIATHLTAWNKHIYIQSSVFRTNRRGNNIWQSFNEKQRLCAFFLFSGNNLRCGMTTLLQILNSYFSTRFQHWQLNYSFLYPSSKFQIIYGFPRCSPNWYFFWAHWTFLSPTNFLGYMLSVVLQAERSLNDFHLLLTGTENNGGLYG